MIGFDRNGEINMNSLERHDMIIQAIAERGTVSVRRAAELTGASEITIRRDFASLADAGVVERYRGGVGVRVGEHMAPFAFRQVRYSEEKAALAQRAAGLLKPDDIVFIDGGTTTFHIATCLPNVPLRIFTNSLRLADALSRRPHLKSVQDVYLTGGLIYPPGGLLVGSGVVQSIQQYHANWAFISVGGVTEQGLYNTDDQVVEAERAMIRNADRVVVLADHSKIGRYATCFICSTDKIDTLITDADPDKSTILPQIEKQGVKIIHVKNPR